MSPSWNYFLILITILTFIVPYSTVIPKSHKALINIQTIIEEKNSIEISKSHKVMSNAVIDNRDKSEAILPINAVKDANGTTVSNSKIKEILDFSFLQERIWIIWILGVMLYINLKIIGGIRFKKKLKMTSSVATSQDVKDTFYHCCDQLGIHKNIILKVCKEIGTPMVTGIFTPVITIPTEEFDLNTLRMIFTHELMHL